MLPGPIVFVIRASVATGLGHLVRSLCVLRELQGKTQVSVLLLGDGSGSHLIETAKIEWAICSSDLEAAERIHEVSPELVVFDTLTFEDDAYALAAAGAVTISLSPVFSQMPRVHHLFHRTRNENPSWSRESVFPKVHKGLEYSVLPAWLRPVTSRVYREHLSEERLAVAISMGGTDAPNRTLEMLQLFGESASKLVLFVALGDAYTHSYEELLTCASDNRQEIILLKSNESMWRVLRSTSLVICAGGLTTYEAIHIGIPAINILQRPDWAYLFAELDDCGASRTFLPSTSSLKQAVAHVTFLEENRDALLSMHLATKGLIPAGGARRIAAQMLRFARQKQKLINY